VEKHGIAYHEKKLGQLFCDGSSRQIIDMLLRECLDAQVEIRCGCQVLKVQGGDSFSIETDCGTFASSSLVIATGGLSIPSLGASDFGYRIARQFELEIQEPVAGLVPLTLPPQMLQTMSRLSGVSVDVLVSFRSQEFRENILITHRGLSGPAILQISSYWQPGEPISINLMPDDDVLELLTGRASAQDSTVELVHLLSRHLPKRFALAWCELYGASKPLKQYNSRELRDTARQLHNMQITPSGTEGFKKAEVTKGGVATTELSSQTMQAKRVPGLYFIGEVVDVTGQLGGYNFQWAWASGYTAGQYV
jgi:predicted Rossmann fold flavoprotein